MEINIEERICNGVYRVQKYRKILRFKPGLKGIDLKIEKGQFVTLLGPSGCGKSTLLRCLAGLEEVNGGRIFLDGEDITDKEPKGGILEWFSSSTACFQI